MVSMPSRWKNDLLSIKSYLLKVSAYFSGIPEHTAMRLVSVYSYQAWVVHGPSQGYLSTQPWDWCLYISIRHEWCMVHLRDTWAHSHEAGVCVFLSSMSGALSISGIPEHTAMTLVSVYSYQAWVVHGPSQGYLTTQPWDVSVHSYQAWVVHGPCLKSLPSYSFQILATKIWIQKGSIQWCEQFLAKWNLFWSCVCNNCWWPIFGKS